MATTPCEVVISVQGTSNEEQTNKNVFDGNNNDEDVNKNKLDAMIKNADLTNSKPDRQINNDGQMYVIPLSNDDERQDGSRDLGTAIEQPLGSQQIMFAATLILDAKKGRNLRYALTEKHVRLYNLYHSPILRWILYAALAFNLSLALFEKPSIPNASIPYWGTMILELMCIAYFVFRCLHVLSFQSMTEFLHDHKTISTGIIIILTLIDMFVYILWVNLSPDTHPVRWSRPLRPLLIVSFPDGKQIRRAFSNIRRTVPDIMNVLILFFLSVFLAALLGLKLFSKRDLSYPNGDKYFSNYFDCVWDLYVLVTTANNPDVMMPAYDKNNWVALFFIIFMVLCSYIFMSIVLATIYTNYKKNLEEDIRKAVFAKRKKLLKAFDLLKVERNLQKVITYTRWKQLMNFMMPEKSSVYIDLMMKVLDDDNNNVLNQKNFMNLSDLLCVKLTEVKDRKTLLEIRFPHFYNHKYSNIFKMIVRHRFFRYAFDFIIVINAVFIAVDLDEADWFFLPIFIIEIICKLYTLGGREFFRRKWNVFDFFIIGAAFITIIVEEARDISDAEFSSLDVLLILRVLRLIKLFGSIKRFKIILQTLMSIGPSILTYGAVIFIFYYIFAIIGMEVFSGYIHYYGYNTSKMETAQLFCGNLNLNSTSFYQSHYCSNNFNNILKALVLMFELTVVNQWHVITSGFVHVTNTAAKLYFFLFHLCSVVIVLNIFTAFVLEAFILEYNLQTVPRIESVVEKKIKDLGLGIGMRPKFKSILGPSGDRIELIDDEVVPEGREDQNEHSLKDLSKEKGFKFHLQKTGQKNVEVLLQQMFHGEISNCGDDSVNEDELQNKMRDQRFTLDKIT